jgi:hypothetical protein
LVSQRLPGKSQRVSTAKSPNDVANAEKQSGFTPVGQVPLQNSPPQPAPVTQAAPALSAPATSPELVQQLEAMARHLAVLQRSVKELAGKQEHLAAAQEQLAAKQEQIDQNIAKPRAVKPEHQAQDVVPAAQKCAPARGRTRSTTIPKISLQRSNIPQKIIRFCLSRQLDGIYDRDKPIAGESINHGTVIPPSTVSAWPMT